MDFLITKPGTQKRVAVVTGGNKGIGFEIVRQLANNGIMVLLTARDEKRGTEAVEKLTNSGVSDVLFHQLDVSDPASVLSLAQFIKINFGKLDILVNNAAVSGIELEPDAMDFTQTNGILNKMKYFNSAKQTYEMAKECLNINYYGTKSVTETLIPLLQLSLSPNIVNISALYGQLNFIPNKNIQKELSEVDDQTEVKIDQMLQKFLNDMKENKLEENEWPTQVAAYKVSKVALNTYTRIIARKLNTFSINCVNPGFVRTDMNWNSGISTTEEGATCPVMLALLPNGSPSGFFYDNNMEVISFQ
ncbi:salutaridine reductase-like [Dioscorea cayenensis subsp. rotundata]|uniref:Short-chain dehydrogenase/reductase n=1 Tax=Dioscorea cayennensis subsp. rotundata TaxID=55577 RepID=A0AB40C4E5_DIOCR|nr:salutaridine reductase-like [Dioscorea cayenensis subsp. rotundata]